MLQRVDGFIREHNLLVPGNRLVVAVSGGPDSVCLLHVLHRLSQRWDWTLVVAHLEHGLRGASSLGDAFFVERLATQLGWPVAVLRCDIKSIIRQRGGSVQDVCRQERQAFLQQTAKSWDAQAIILAHHAGDQAETVLLHLSRGAGLAGLAGMAARDVVAGEIAYVRPLLRESKTDIMAYLRGQTVGFRVDASNAAADYARNRLRLEIMPLLAAINPDVEAALARSAQVVRAEDEYLNQLAQDAFRRSEYSGTGALSLALSQLANFPLAIKRRILRLAWKELTGGPQNLSFGHVEAALALLTQEVGSVTSWPLDWQVRRSYDRLVWESVQPEIDDTTWPLALPGVARLAEGGEQIIASVLTATEFEGYSADQNVAYCDLASLSTAQLQVRYWQPGDSFYPLGLCGSKKLQDYFTDIKLDRRERTRVPIVVRGDQIVWIAGYRLDERWRVTATSQKLLRLEYRRYLKGS